MLLLTVKKKASLTFKWNYKWISMECYGSQYFREQKMPQATCLLLKLKKACSCVLCFKLTGFFINVSLTEGELFKNLNRCLSPFIHT